MFLTGQFFLFRTLVAVCDPAFELHTRVLSAREFRVPGHRQQRVFEIKNCASSKTWRTVKRFIINVTCNCLVLL